MDSAIQPKLLKPNLVVLAELAGVNGQVNKGRNILNYHEIVFLPILLVLTLGELDILSSLPIRASPPLCRPLHLWPWRSPGASNHRFRHFRHQNLTLDEFSPDDNSAFEAPQVHRTCEGGEDLTSCSHVLSSTWDGTFRPVVVA